MGVHAPSAPLQHAVDPSVWMSRGDKFCEIGDLQSTVGDSVRLGSNFGGSHGCVVVVNGYSGLNLAHRVRIGVDV